MSILLKMSAELGSTGTKATKEHSELFEAWMKGHCWEIHGKFDGENYVSENECPAFCDYDTMSTRMLFAAFRDGFELGRKINE